MSKKTRQRLDAGLKAKVALRHSATRRRLPSWRPNISCTRTRFMPGTSGWLTARRVTFGAQVRTMSRAERLAVVEPAAGLSLRRQCALLGLAHCRVYRQPVAPDPFLLLPPAAPTLGHQTPAAVWAAGVSPVDLPLRSDARIG
jgi:hypothetical protein